MHRVVLDTVVFVRSLINPRSIWGQVVFQYFPHYRSFVSHPVLVEILEVLKRPELTGKFQSLEDRDIKRVIEIISEAEVVEVISIPSISRDIKDDKFLATAKAANADYLVSADKDLLDLEEYEGVKIIDAESFVKILEQELRGKK